MGEQSRGHGQQRHARDDARRLLADFEAAFEDLRAHAERRKGRVSIAALPSLAAGDLPPLLAQFRARYPGIVLELFDQLADGCIEELGSVMIYSGDDRMVVLHDPEGAGSVHEATVLDALGRIAYRPWWSPWNDVGLRRCTAQRNLGTAFYDEADWFTTVGWTAYDDWGVPPTFPCDD